MLNKIQKISYTLGLLTLPVLTFAQTTGAGNLGKTYDLLDSVLAIVSDILIPLAFTVALLVFFWGVAKYIRTSGDKEEGRKIMVWGVIALTVMTLIWGIVYFIGDELGLTDPGDPIVPSIAY